MIIIVDGVDAVGKDTFISNLSKLTNLTVVRGSSFQMSEEGADKMFERSKMLLEQDDIIMNRSFYSNAVYGPMYNYPTMTDEQFEELNRIAEAKAIIYYLTADTDLVKERLEKRGDDKVRSDEIDDIKAGYKHMWKRFKPKNLVTIDVSDANLLDIDSDIYTEVLEYNREHKDLMKLEPSSEGLEG